jgi:hypothetical protein
MNLSCVASVVHKPPRPPRSRILGSLAKFQMNRWYFNRRGCDRPDVQSYVGLCRKITKTPRAVNNLSPAP